jgi:hypothetical protein
MTILFVTMAMGVAMIPLEGYKQATHGGKRSHQAGLRILSSPQQQQHDTKDRTTAPHLSACVLDDLCGRHASMQEVSTLL